MALPLDRLMAAVALQALPFCLTFTLLVDQDAPKPHRRFKGGKMSPVPRTACQGPDQGGRGARWLAPVAVRT